MHFLRRATALAAATIVMVVCAIPVRSAAFTVDGSVALSSLMALSDSHLRKLEDMLQLVAAGDAARSAEWEKIRPALAQLQSTNIPAVLWFALPDGTYWTLDSGKQKVRLADRPYFPTLLAKKDVVGDLVASKSTGKTTAIVAVPILRDGRMVGALGASVYLEAFSSQIKQEMNLPPGTIFFSFDSRALVALNWDPSLIFLEPRKLSPALDRAFTSMLAHTQGVETYEFRGRMRTVLYRKSAVTGWWYALGVVL